MLRWTIETLNRTFASFRRKRRANIPDGFTDVRLNLGCGLAVTQGWINIDGSINALISSLPSGFHRIMYQMTGAKRYYSELEYCCLLGNNFFIHHDLGGGIPFHDGVADYIYTSHFLEHLYRHDARNLMLDCHRVLKTGGLLRISVPDLAYAISLYTSGRKDEMLQKFFFVEDDANQYSRHKYMYDYNMLHALLTEIGFREIVRCQFKKGQVPDITILDNRQEESLFIEARK